MNQIHKYGSFLPIVVWLSRQLVFLMGLQHFHIQDSFFLQFNFPQANKLLVFMHTIFSWHACSVSQITSEMCIITIKFICKKRKYHSLKFGSEGNRSSLWAYNTTISKTLFFLQFQHSSAKQIVSFHALYIFKTMHTNSPSNFHLFKGTKKK
jgi:hypothetical protein